MGAECCTLKSKDDLDHRRSSLHSRNQIKNQTGNTHYVNQVSLLPPPDLLQKGIYKKNASAQQNFPQEQSRQIRTQSIDLRSVSDFDTKQENKPNRIGTPANKNSFSSVSLRKTLDPVNESQWQVIANLKNKDLQNESFIVVRDIETVDDQIIVIDDTTTKIPPASSKQNLIYKNLDLQKQKEVIKITSNTGSEAEKIEKQQVVSDNDTEIVQALNCSNFQDQDSMELIGADTLEVKTNIQTQQQNTDPYLHKDGENHYYWDQIGQQWIQYDPLQYTPFKQQQKVEQKTSGPKKLTLLEQVQQDSSHIKDFHKTSEELSYAKNRDTRQQIQNYSENLPQTPPDQRIIKRIQERKIPGKINPLFLLKLTEKINKTISTTPQNDQREQKEDQSMIISDRPTQTHKKPRTQSAQKFD